MTERTGRRARWSAALLLTPGAAVLFGTSMTWALHAGQQPAAAAQPVQVPAVRAVPSEPPPSELLALQRVAATNQRQLEALRTRMTVLQRQLKALTAPLPHAKPTAGGNAAIGGAGPVTGTGSVTGQLPAGSQRQAPAQAPVQAAAPVPAAPPVQQPAPVVAAPAPPPVQAVTGASGTRK